MKKVIIFLQILFDQFTKIFLSKVNFPFIHYAENRGIFFGIPLNPYLVIIFSLVILCVLAYYFLKEENMALGIILAGLFVIVGFLINQGKTIGALEERTKNIGESLFNLGKDFKQHLDKHRR